MEIVYPDGSWFIGKRNWKAMGYLFNHETRGTHHFFVLDVGTRDYITIGDEVAVPIDRVDMFILNLKED